MSLRSLLCLSPKGQGVVLGLVAAVIWGAFYTVSRQAIGSGLSAADIAFIRYGTTALILAPLALRRWPDVKALGWKRGILLAALGGPLFVMVSASGYHFAPLSHAAVVQLGTITILCAIAGALWLNEKLGPKAVTGLVILIAGLVTVAGPSLFHGSSTTWIGDAFFVLAGIGWSAFTVLLRRWRVNAIAATIAVTYFSAAIFCPAYLIFADKTALLSVAPSIVFEQAFVQGILTGIVALFAYSRAVHLLGAARAAVFSAFAPAASILLGIVLVHETPDALQWLGLIIASAGMATILAPSKTRG